MAVFREQSTCAIALLGNARPIAFVIYSPWTTVRVGNFVVQKEHLAREVENAALKFWKHRAALLGVLIRCEKQVILRRLWGCHIQDKNDFVQIL